ncbi:MAG: PQQ-binding-like beta-propeller repeat protein [Fimbriimonas sp.]|nr:PQQ-binding-like beta-propeller repeat protein [Fimbriimonas sp.]
MNSITTSEASRLDSLVLASRQNRSPVRLVLLLLLLLGAVSAQAQLSNSAWAKFRGNALNNGQSSGSAVTSTFRFTTPITSAFYSSPCVANGLVYVGAGSDLVAINSDTGAIEWTFNANSVIYSSPAVSADGTVYVGAINALFAINGSTGQQVWTFPVPGQIFSSPAIGPDGTIYVGDFETYSGFGHFYALSSAGAQKWSLQTAAIVSSAAIGTDGTVYVGADDSNVYALDPATGSTKYSYKTGDYVQGAPAIGPDGSVYAVSNDGYLYALSSKLEFKWSSLVGIPHTYSPEYVSSPAVSSNGIVYVGSANGHLYSFASDGTLNWTFTTALDPYNNPYSIQSSPALGSDGTVYIGPSDGNVYALNPAGSVNWVANVTNQTVSSPALAQDGTLYVCAETALVAFKNVLPASLTVSPTMLIGGTAASGTITLSTPAPVGGAVVTLTSSNSAASVPPTIAIAAGSTSGAFAIATTSVSQQTPVTISGSLNGQSVTASLTVNPLIVVSAVSVSPTTVVGGSSKDAVPVAGTVTLSGPALPGGTLVTLASGNSAASVPSTVTVAAGSTTTTFAVKTSVVSQPTPVKVSASLNGQTVSTTLTVTPSLYITSLTLDPSSVVAENNVTGKVTLNRAVVRSDENSDARGAVWVSLTSNRKSGISMPKGLLVLRGQNVGTVTLKVDKSFTPPVTADITATFHGSATATLTAAYLRISSITLRPSTVVGGYSSTCTITLNGKDARGAVAKLECNSPSVVLPKSVLIGANQSVTFTVNTKVVSSLTTAVISARADDALAGPGGSAQATLTIEPYELMSVRLGPASVLGGQTSLGTVIVSPDVARGSTVDVMLASDNREASVPSKVTIRGDSQRATFNVQTLGFCLSPTYAVITATLNGSKSARLTIDPDVCLTSVTVNPLQVNGGDTVTGKVYLNRNRPATGQIVVTLRSSDTSIVQVPSTVEVSFGRLTATFQIHTSKVQRTGSAIITATFNKSATATLRVVVPKK